MKRLIPFVLIIVLLCAVFTACKGSDNSAGSPGQPDPQSTGGELPTIRLLVDFISDGIGDSILNYVQWVPGYGTDFKVDYTYLPRTGAERESQLTSIRTEILAGKGPDIFICCCPNFNYDNSKPLFLFPNQVMERRAFLPLDSYLENAEYMEWDKLFQPVMEAGKNEEGQQLLPMSYQITAMLFDSELYSCIEELPMTWEMMKASNDPIIQYAGSFQSINNLFGELADYRNDQLSFTEDELLLRYSELCDLNRLRDQQDLNGLYKEKGGTTLLDIGAPSIPLLGDKLDDSSPNYIMIPMYNVDGGVTANITSFAAINRNTTYPELSFRMLDCLLSKDVQSRSSIYGNVMGTPVHMELAQKGQHAQTIFGGTWYMNEWNFAQFSSLRDQVNEVKFYTELDELLIRMSEEENKPLDKVVHDCYTKMQMLLAES